MVRVFLRSCFQSIKREGGESRGVQPKAGIVIVNERLLRRRDSAASEYYGFMRRFQVDQLLADSSPTSPM